MNTACRVNQDLNQHDAEISSRLGFSKFIGTDCDITGLYREHMYTDLEDITSEIKEGDEFNYDLNCLLSALDDEELLIIAKRLRYHATSVAEAYILDHEL